MADNNVIPFPSRTQRARAALPSADSMRTVLEHLDRMNRCLDEVTPTPTWNPDAWRVNSLQLRMTLSDLLELLHTFEHIEPGDWTDGIGWVLGFVDGCAELERRLIGVDACLNHLLDPRVPTADRAHRHSVYYKRTRELSRAIDIVRQLILKAYSPIAVRRRPS
jgi:hypothetical protein